MGRLMVWFAILGVAVSAHAALTPRGLRCEYLEDPEGITERVPRLTWGFVSDRGGARGERQTAYQILVASEPGLLLPGEADLWDSGRVVSDESVLVAYDGAELRSRQTCSWIVRVWDGDGDPGPWSEVGYWSMGLLSESDWTAAWIGLAPEGEGPRYPASYFRHGFAAQPGIRRAVVYVTAAGCYELYLNGRRVGRDLLTPGWPEFADRIYTQAYDVTDLLYGDASNAIGAVVGDGWYGLHHGGRGRTRLLAQLEIEYDGGGRQVVGTGGDWRGTDRGPVCMSDIYDGETYDARLDLGGWASVGYDDSAWREVVAGRRDRDAWHDCTETVRDMVAAGAESIPASNEAYGDPAFRTAKTLELVCRIDGEEQLVRVPEGQSVMLLGQEPEGGITVLEAAYGAGDAWNDVTVRVRDAVRDGRLRIPASNDLFGDPIYGTEKELRVRYRVGDGPEQEAVCAEDSVLELGDAGLWLPRQGLEVVSARYGVHVPDVIADAVLERHPGSPIRATQELRAVALTEPRPGVYVYDFGQNFAGWVRLRVVGEAGTEVRMRFAEMLNPDGTIYTTNLRGAKCTDLYTLAGTGTVEEWEPRFTFHGFRYVEVTGFPGEPPLDALTGVVVHSDCPLTSSFVCSNPLINQLNSNTVWGQRSNYLEVPTDCPQRDERMGWSGDAQVFIRTGAYHMDIGAFFTAWMKTFNDTQTADGAYPNVSPVGWGVSPAWGDAGIICPEALYRAYGDDRVIREHFEGMERWITYLRERSHDLVRPAEGFGDWLNVDDPMPHDVISTAYFAYVTRLLSEMAVVIGREREADEYAVLAAEIRDAFVDAFVDRDNGRIKGDTQTTYLMALGFDLLPDELRPFAADRLLELIEARDWHLSTGFLGVNLLLPVLTEIGRTDVAYRLLQNTTYPSWGYSIVNGATTIWERWNSYTREHGFGDPGMNSFNHYAYGSCGQWMFETMAGIDTLAPGFRRLLIAPQPGGGIEFVRAEYDSIRGHIAVAWERVEAGLDLEVTVPINVTARVRVPVVAGAVVHEGGGAVEDAPGVRVVERGTDALLLDIGSGTYRFEAR